MEENGKLGNILFSKKVFMNVICWTAQEHSQEELPQVQGQGHWQRFAGAAVKRYPRSKVRGIGSALLEQP